MAVTKIKAIRTPLTERFLKFSAPLDLRKYDFTVIQCEIFWHKNKPAFREKHQAELMIFESARKALMEYFGEKKWDSLKGLQAERGSLTAEQDRLYAERERIKKQLKEVETVRGNVDRILKTEGREAARAVII